MFFSSKLYRPSDVEMRQIATVGTLGVWRCKGQGPPYLKIGSRVAYRGSDLNRWLSERIVRPPAARANDDKAEAGAAMT